MSGKPITIGPAGRAVGGNVKKLRKAKNLTYVDVATSLSQTDSKLSPIAVRRIEECQRRIDADEISSLALVLGVSPAHLFSELEVSTQITVKSV